MAPRQLTPAEQIDLSNLAYTLAHDPQTRGMFAQLVTAKFPERAGSFSDVQMRGEIGKLRKEIENDKILQRSKEFERNQRKQRDDLVTSGRYSPTQVDEIKAVMDRNGIVDYNIGAVLYAHETKPVSTMAGPPRDKRPGAVWEFGTVPGQDGKMLSFADFVKNPTAAAYDAAYQTIDSFARFRPQAR